jgi:hypothetical protein
MASSHLPHDGSGRRLVVAPAIAGRPDLARDTLDREVVPGRHRVMAHNTLSSHTFEFATQAGEDVRIRCLNTTARGGVLMMLTTGFAFITVRLEREEV